MKFFTYSDRERPIRLSENTRRFAYESLNFKYGLDTLKTPNVSLDGIEGYSELSALGKYNAAIYEISTKAPVRICDGERLSGAATLGDAIGHKLPAKYCEEMRDWSSCTSHLTVDFCEALETGMDGIREKAVRSLKKHTEPYKIEFLESCIHCIDCMKIWHERYINALSEKDGYEDNVRNLRQVPFGAANGFYEAVQSLWFCFAFLRLCGTWPGIGRIDVILGKYLEKDLADGVITLDEAREILAHFFIKGCEWITGEPTVSGDAQHYQNIVLSGIDENGEDVTNEVTYLVLDIVEETGISDFPITVRINSKTDEKLLHRVSEVISVGGGVVAVYNEELILDALADMGYPRSQAAGFANDGCWEVQIPGRTKFSYIPFDGLGILQRETLDSYSGEREYKSFDELLEAYLSDLDTKVDTIFRDVVLGMFEADGTTFRRAYPCTVVALFEHPCIERGLPYHEGGTEYTVISPHIGGLPDTVNSLYAIKKAVFEDKLLPYHEFMRILHDNWEGNDELRERILTKYTYYGNDNNEVDEIAAEILNRFSARCKTHDGKTCVRFISGVSTFGRQIDWAPSRIASPFGKKAGEILAGNLSPTPGTDKNGVTAIIKSYCKADLSKQHSGAALDIGLSLSSFADNTAVATISSLIKSFVTLGGFFMQIDPVSKAVLLEAQKNPDSFRTLSVRVSGWSARFVTMNKQWQDMIIGRTK